MTNASQVLVDLWDAPPADLDLERPIDRATTVTFAVHGKPQGQGSKTIGRTKGGKSFVREDNPQTKPWRTAIGAAAGEAMDGRSLIRQAVRVTVQFGMPRPMSHYGSGRNAGVLKSTAPRWCVGIADLDKLQRALGDALTNVVLADDGQVVEWRTSKPYADPPVTWVMVETIAP